MKCIMYATLLYCSVYFVSCSGKTDDRPAMMTQNLALVKNIREAIDSNQWSRLDQYIAADAIDHDGDQGYIKGLDSIKMMIQQWHGMAEEKIQVIRELADDEYVMSWIDSKGKYLTAGQGHKAGESFATELMDISRIKDVKVVEHWMMMTPADVMKMMASTSAPAVQTVKENQPDSTVKKKVSK